MLTIQEAPVTQLQGHVLSVADKKKGASHQNACQEPRASGKHQIDGPSTMAEAGVVHISKTTAHLFQELFIQV